MCQTRPQFYCKARKRGGRCWSRGLNALFHRQVGCAYEGAELSFQTCIFFKSLTLSTDTGNIYLVFEGSYSVFLKVSLTSLFFCIPFFLTFSIASALPLLMGEQGSVLDPVFSLFFTWRLPMCSPGFSHQPEFLCRGSQGYSSNQDPHR